MGAYKYCGECSTPNNRPTIEQVFSTYNCCGCGAEMSHNETPGEMIQELADRITVLEALPKPAKNDFTWKHSRGASMGPHYVILMNGHCIGHFYDDSANAVDLEDVFEQLGILEAPDADI